MSMPEFGWHRDMAIILNDPGNILRIEKSGMYSRGPFLDLCIYNKNGFKIWIFESCWTMKNISIVKKELLDLYLLCNSNFLYSETNLMAFILSGK